MSGLTERQSRFVAEMGIDNNATQAAVRAGYSSNGAAVAGSRLLRMPKVAAALNTARQEIAARNELTVDGIVSGLRALAGNPDEPAAARVRAWELLGRHIGMWDERVQPVQHLEIPAHWTVDDVLRFRDEIRSREA